MSLFFIFKSPEIFSKTVEIKSIAREAGSRTKVAVYSNEEGIDPVGSCVGQRGSRIQTIINELGGEKSDIIEWNDDVSKYIQHALSPAKIVRLDINKEKKSAIAFVQEDQLSLAIGKQGQNVRLSAKLTGWKIDILKEKVATDTEEGENEKIEETAEENNTDDTKKEKETKKETETDTKKKVKKEKETKKKTKSEKKK